MTTICYISSNGKDNPNFKVFEFDHFRMQTGLLRKVLEVGLSQEPRFSLFIY